jgi:hypothetical protein
LRLGVFRSLPLAIKEFTPSPLKEHHGALPLAPCMPLSAVCIRFVLYSLIKLQLRIANYLLNSHDILEGIFAPPSKISLSTAQCLRVPFLLICLLG